MEKKIVIIRDGKFWGFNAKSKSWGFGKIERAQRFACASLAADQAFSMGASVLILR